jgi:hypothetical protein
LEFAFFASNAGEAIHPVVGQSQLQRVAAAPRHFFGIGEYLHPFRGGIDTGRNQGARTLDLNDADAAGADGVDLFHIAKGGDFDTGQPGSF